MNNLKEFSKFTTFQGLKKEFEKLTPDMKDVVKLFLKEITNLKYKNGFIEADKKKEGWEFTLNKGSKEEYTLNIYYPVKDTKRYRHIEKYDTRDELSKIALCDMDTAETDKDFTIYNVAWCFTISN